MGLCLYMVEVNAFFISRGFVILPFIDTHHEHSPLHPPASTIVFEIAMATFNFTSEIISGKVNKNWTVIVYFNQLSGGQAHKSWLKFTKFVFFSVTFTSVTHLVNCKNFSGGVINHCLLQYEILRNWWHKFGLTSRGNKSNNHLGRQKLLLPPPRHHHHQKRPQNV